MKGRPIIMGAESVRAILEGRKTQTRRVINPKKYNIAGWDMPRTKEDMEAGYPFAENADGDSFSVVDWCPYGRAGDRLWVRETWAQCQDGRILYKADPMFIGCEKGDFAWDWESPMSMPRKASRITLEITDIRIERVQDISEEDAIAEASVEYVHNKVKQMPEETSADRIKKGLVSIYINIPRICFGIAWNLLNAKRGYPFESNPWVWVIVFKVVSK